MAQLLKQSTAYTFQLGPFVDSTDGVTPETSLTIAATDVDVSKNGGAFADKSDATALTSTGDSQGYYDCVLDTTDTGTLGKLEVRCYVSGALPVLRVFQVVPAHVYDGLIAGTDNLQVDTIQAAGTAWGSGAITAGSIATDAIGSDEISAAAVTKIQAGLATPTNITAGTITTVTNLTNAPTNGDLTATMKSSVTTAATAATPTAAAVTGNVGGNVVGSVASVTAEVSADVVKISGDGTAADRLEAVLDAMPTGLVVDDNDPDPLATAFETNLTETTNDHYNGAFLVFSSGVLLGQSRKISDYDGTSKVITVAVAFTEAPAGGDAFLIVGRSE